MGKTILYIALCLSVGVFGFTVGRFTDVMDVGGKTFQRGKMLASLNDLEGAEKDVAMHLVKGSDKIAKKVVSAMGDAAKDEKKVASVLKGIDKDPIMGVLAAVRAPRQQEEDPNKVWAVEPGKVPTKGPENAPITIVEFSDFQCPFCSRGYQTMKQVEEKYPGQIRFEYVSKILPMHPKAPAAHAAAYAAWEQGKFWEFHDKAFENQKDLSPDKYLEWAKDLGLNMDKFQQDMALDKHKDEFDRLDKISDELGVRGTPTYFINGIKIRGARPIDAFTEVIDRILKGDKPQG